MPIRTGVDHRIINQRVLRVNKGSLRLFAESADCFSSSVTAPTISCLAGRHYFSDAAPDTPSSCTSVQSLPGLYSFIAAATWEVFSPRLRW